MLKELKELLSELRVIRDRMYVFLGINNIENKIVSLESAIEILENERRKEDE